VPAAFRGTQVCSERLLEAAASPTRRVQSAGRDLREALIWCGEVFWAAASGFSLEIFPLDMQAIGVGSFPRMIYQRSFALHYVAVSQRRTLFTSCTGYIAYKTVAGATYAWRSALRVRVARNSVGRARLQYHAGYGLLSGGRGFFAAALPGRRRALICVILRCVTDAGWSLAGAENWALMVPARAVSRWFCAPDAVLRAPLPRCFIRLTWYGGILRPHFLRHRCTLT
jgi:hypothetical protein